MAVFLPKLLKNFRSVSRVHCQVRYESAAESCKKGLVLGCYICPDGNGHKFTNNGCKFNSQVGGKLEDQLKLLHVGVFNHPALTREITYRWQAHRFLPFKWMQGKHESHFAGTFPKGKLLLPGKCQVYQVESEFHDVAVVGLGNPNARYNPLENRDDCKEAVRIAAAIGARKLERRGVGNICFDGMGSPEAAAEGAALGLWRYQDCKRKESQASIPQINLFSEEGEREEWERGLFKAEAQNIARRLCDMPANLMTPPIFAQNAVDLLCPCGVGVEVFDREWAEINKFRLFLHVAKGSCEPPVILKLSYCGGLGDEKPIVFIGSGVTFDAGGLCLKKPKGMVRFRADMAGAAVIVAVVRAAAALCLPLNIEAILPLCENMPSGMAMRPGDIIKSMNDKTVLIDDTDNEGRLLLADGLAYASRHFNPRLLVDVGTLTRGINSAVGGAASGVFTNSNDMWKELSKAGAISGDRVWRFPLWKFFTRKVTEIRNADVCNKGMGPGGSPCRAAAFLREFAECADWIHLDIAGSGMMAETEEFSYLPGLRMTGRPVRLLIQFLYQLACPGKGPE